MESVLLESKFLIKENTAYPASVVLSSSILICLAAQDVLAMQTVLETIKTLPVYKAIGLKTILSAYKIIIACLYVIITLVLATKTIHV